MNIRVHIERLVVDGSLGLDSRALEAAVIEGLSQAFLHQPTPPLLHRDGSVAALHGATVHLQGSPGSWGEQLGCSVHAALAAEPHGSSTLIKGPR